MNTESMDGKDILLANSSIKTEEIEIKSEPIDDVPFSEFLHEIKEEGVKEGDTSLQDDSVDIEESKPYDPDLKPTSAESTSSNCKRKQRIYETTSESRSADRADKSDDGDRKAKRLCGGKNKPKPKRERLKAKEYKCDKCEYNTKERRRFTRHLVIHKEMYQCDKCKFVTKRSVSLAKHCLKHKNPSTVPTYACAECEFKTLHKFSLTQHRLSHRDHSEAQKYECNECGYKCKQKASLKAHELKHKHPSEVEMYECSECDYETKYKNCLKVHQLTHQDPSERRFFKCNDCGYKSIYKSELKKHQLQHMEVHVYMCDECAYQSADKGRLRQHQKVHKYYNSLRRGNEVQHADPCEERKFKTDLQRNFKELFKHSPSK